MSFLRLNAVMSIGVFILGLSLPNAAGAAPGDHIGNDTVELVPSLGLSTYFRSNAYLQEGEVGGGTPVTSGMALHLNPKFKLSVDGETSDLGLGFGYNLRKYFDPDLSNLDRFNDLDFKFNAHLLKDAPVGLSFRDRFRLVGYETEATQSADAYIQKLSNSGGASLVIQPGSSLTIHTGGLFTVTDYQGVTSKSVSNSPSLNNRVGYGPAIDLKWKFLPKTAVVADWEMEWFTWRDNYIDLRNENGEGSDGAGLFLGVPNGNTFRLNTGIRGRFTERLVLGLLAGYGSATYDEQSVLDDASNEPDASELDPAADSFGEDLSGFPDGFLFTGEIGYSLSDGQNIQVGYARDFEDVFFSNYLLFRRVYVQYTGEFADRVTLNVVGNYRLEDYRGEVDRDDERLSSQASLTYAATRYLDVQTGFSWRRRVSADNSDSTGEYDTYDIHAGLVFTY